MGVAAEVREGAAETLFRASQVLGAKLPNDQRPTMRILGICRWGVGYRFRRIRTAGEVSPTCAGFKNNRPLRGYNRYMFHSREGM